MKVTSEKCEFRSINLVKKDDKTYAFIAIEDESGRPLEMFSSDPTIANGFNKGDPCRLVMNVSARDGKAYLNSILAYAKEK